MYAEQGHTVNLDTQWRQWMKGDRPLSNDDALALWVAIVGLMAPQAEVRREALAHAVGVINRSKYLVF